jgi:MFS family permease
MSVLPAISGGQYTKLLWDYSFVGALLTRFFLGFVEAAFFPGSLFLLSKWYKRNELGQRTALLSCGMLISNAFGSLIASGILGGMQGVLGHAAWRWLFYIGVVFGLFMGISTSNYRFIFISEGALTIFVAICAIFILPDFPTTSSRWLTPEEARLAVRRMEEDAGVGDESETEPQGQMAGLKMAVSDWRVWWLTIAQCSLVLSLTFNAFFPTLTATLGYDRTVTLLLCAPPWIFSTIVAFLVTRLVASIQQLNHSINVKVYRHSDKVGERFFHIAASQVVGIIGFIIAMSTMNTAARYISL